MSESLTEFLLARIAEDAVRAHEPLAMDRAHAAGCEYITTADHFTPECDCNMSARVLADGESKRQIVEDCAKWERVHREASTYMRADDINLMIYHAKRSVSGDTLRALALPYADHDDYREEWRP